MFITVNILRSVLHKIKHFHFRWGEVLTSCQNGGWAADARWRLVGVTKICEWVGIRSSIVGYVQVPSTSKCWSKTTTTVNCVSIILIFQWSFKWLKIFFISQWKYERTWSLLPATCCKVNNIFLVPVYCIVSMLYFYSLDSDGRFSGGRHRKIDNWGGGGSYSYIRVQGQ